MITKLTADVENIKKMPDRATEADGYTATANKAKFDKAGVDIKAYINEILTTEIDEAIQDIENSKADISELDNKLDITGDFQGTWNGHQFTETDIGLQYTVDQHTSQLAESTKCEVYNESDLITAISNKNQSIIFKDNVTIKTPLNLDRFSVSIDLNGFVLKLSDDYSYDYMFRTGETEYDDFYTKYYKWIYNGIIDINDKNAYVINHTFTWQLSCKKLRVVNTRQGFIKYTVAGGQTTRGAESYLDDVTIIGSDNIGNDTIAFDWYIGDSFLSNLYSHYFTIGLKVRVGGVRVSNCHFWGLPTASGSLNKVMKIGVWNAEYYNNYIGIIVDTPDRYDTSIVASNTNGGIAFYDELGASVKYINCDILEHSSTSDNSLICFYIDKPPVVDDIWYGQSVVIDSCYSRNPSKLSKGIYFTGDTRNLNIINTDLAINRNGRVRGHSRLTSNSLIFKYDVNAKNNEGLSDFSLCSGKSEFQMINDDYGISFLVRDTNKAGIWCRVNENRSNSYSTSQLQTLASGLKTRQAVTGQVNHMTQIYVVKFDLTVADGLPGRYDLCFWNTGAQAFYNLRTGVKETT